MTYSGFFVERAQTCFGWVPCGQSGRTRAEDAFWQRTNFVIQNTLWTPYNLRRGPVCFAKLVDYDRASRKSEG